MKADTSSLTKGLIFLSVYSPKLFSTLSIFQAILWASVFVLAFYQYILVSKIKTSTTSISLHLFVISILIALTVSTVSVDFDSSKVLTSIGGVEAYLQIYAAFMLATIFAKNVCTLDVEKFIAIFVAPITSASIVSYLIFPDATFAIINQHVLGYSNSGQWRFSSFYGLPYYAAIAYIYYIAISIEVIRVTPSSPFVRAYLAASILLLIIGGALTASKTFIAGFAILIVYLISNRDIDPKKKVLLMLLVPASYMTIYITIFSDLKNSIPILESTLKLITQNLSSPIQAVIFRYSQENDAVSELFNDSAWNWATGVGLQAAQVATDSQARDVMYRFGLIGSSTFAIFIIFTYLNLRKHYRMLFLAIAIGALGSNTFTPINFTFIIWFCFFKSQHDSKRDRKKVINFAGLRTSNFNVIES